MRLQAYGGEAYYEEHYTRLGSPGEAMLALLAGLRAAPAEMLVFLLTSHSTLCLMSQDDYDPVGWHVCIEPPWEGPFKIEYRAMGSGELIKLHAHDLEVALDKTLFAMRASGGWLPG